MRNPTVRKAILGVMALLLVLPAVAGLLSLGSA